jgi:hypothetical protein
MSNTTDFTVSINSSERSTTDIKSLPTSFYIDLTKNQNVMKNIVGVKLSSAEISNSFNIVGPEYNNNYFTLHLPDKVNNPDGFKINLSSGIVQTQQQFVGAVNKQLNIYLNTNRALSGTLFPNSIFAEKYLYFFYMYQPTILTISYNLDTDNTTPIDLPDDAVELQPSLALPIELPVGWYSLYGMVLQIKNYITYQYTTRQVLLKSNPNLTPITFDTSNFRIENFNVNIFDRRFRSDINSDNPGDDCTRHDLIPEYIYFQSNITSNLELLKTIIYKCYIYDTVNFNIRFKKDTPQQGNGILDNMMSGAYPIPNGYYTGGQLYSKDPNTGKLVPDNNGSPYLKSYSIYHINNLPNAPKAKNTQIYNLLLSFNESLTQFSFVNSFNPEVNPANTISNPEQDFYYYYIDNQVQDWNPLSNDNFYNGDNIVVNLLDLDDLFYYDFISEQQYYDPTYIPTLELDSPPFTINFTTKSVTPTSNKYIQYPTFYPSLGTILGFNDGLNIPVPDQTNSYWVIIAPNINQLYGSYYIKLRLGDTDTREWGALSLLNTTNDFSKVLLPNSIKADYATYSTSTSIINPNFYFIKPIKQLKRLYVQLVDIYDNILNSNGVDFSFTLIFILSDVSIKDYTKNTGISYSNYNNSMNL